MSWSTILKKPINAQLICIVFNLKDYYNVHKSWQWSLFCVLCVVVGFFLNTYIYIYIYIFFLKIHCNSPSSDSCLSHLVVLLLTDLWSQFLILFLTVENHYNTVVWIIFALCQGMKNLGARLFFSSVDLRCTT